MTSAPEGRVFTIPNLISLARLLCVPVFVWLLWGADRPIAAGVLLAVLGATDWVDGYIARHVPGQASELGKVLDPVADRALLVAGAIALLVEDLPLAVDVVLWIVLAREVLIAVATVGLGIAGAKRIDVVWAGKAGTLALMFALPLFLLADNTDGAWQVWWYLCAWGFAIGGMGLGYYAALKYVPAAREALRQGRAARAHEIAEVGA
jgi:cardiolipin synthase (CMP-forming)